MCCKSRCTYAHACVCDMYLQRASHVSVNMHTNDGGLDRAVMPPSSVRMVDVRMALTSSVENV